MPNARSTSSEEMTREPCAEDEATTTAERPLRDRIFPASRFSVAEELRLESRNAASTDAKLAGRSLRPDPKSDMPLAVSTARRKLTHAMESRIPARIKSTFSPGSGAETPPSLRQQAP